MTTIDQLRILQAARFTTRDAMAAAGTPDARFQQRFKESRLPLSAIALDAMAKRRSYTLADCYMLRLLEVLAGPGRLDVKPAIEALREIAFHDLPATVTNLDGTRPPSDEWSIFREVNDHDPTSWQPAWKARDLASPYWIAAREYHFGWRHVVTTDLSGLALLPRPDTAPAGGSFAVLFNLTEELNHVDHALLSALILKSS